MLPFSSMTPEHYESDRKKEKPRPKGRSSGLAYGFALQALAVASHIPPALVQAALVLAAVTSAARVGAVKATAMPRATIADTSFFIDTSPPFVGLPLGSAFKLNVQRASGAEAKPRCGKNTHRFARLSIAAVLCHHRDVGLLGVSNLLLRRNPVMGKPCRRRGFFAREQQRG